MNPLKTFHWGHRGARDNFATQICTLVEASYRSLGDRPVVIGECGVPMDMNGRMAFNNDDWKWQRRMMDAMITALEWANAHTGGHRDDAACSVHTNRQMRTGFRVGVPAFTNLSDKFY